MQKTISLFLVLLFTACSLKPEANGRENEIIVLVSSEDRIFVQPQLEKLFSKYINTPQEEKELLLIYKAPWELDKYQYRRNIILAALTFPEDSTGDILAARFIKSVNKDTDFFILTDLYAKNQLFTVINATDAIEFQDVLNKNGQWLISEITGLMFDQLTQYVYSQGKFPELSAEVEEIFNVTLDLQPDFKVLKKDLQYPFIWLGRGYPYRWISIHKCSSELMLAASTAWAQIELDFMTVIPSIKISFHFRFDEIIEINGKQIKVFRGIYEHDDSASGGPFFVYVFESGNINEVILVSGFVNYPGHQKLLLLKQLEIIASTFQ